MEWLFTAGWPWQLTQSAGSNVPTVILPLSDATSAPDVATALRTTRQ